MAQHKIIYTYTDEAPALATHSLFPLIKFFLEKANVQIEMRDISLAGRILASFPECLTDEQKQDDDLAYLGLLVKEPEANVIKLPNISASIPQLQAAIKELQSQGYKVPEFLPDSTDKSDKSNADRYKKILGSAVNPVLREGNSDRRVAKAVKQFAQANPHSMGDWHADSKTHVSHMDDGDFYSSEKSLTMDNDDVLKIELVNKEGFRTLLKENLKVLEGEVIDAARMSVKSLRKFLKDQKKKAKEEGILYSIHLKATMMKISDPIMFGHAVETFFEELFSKYSNELDQVGYKSKDGLGSLEQLLDKLDSTKAIEIRDFMQKLIDVGPSLAMVDSDKGITNLHVPSDVIIDASMPAAIRAGGKMWNAHGETQDMKAIIPDRSYAVIYDEIIRNLKEHGALDVTKVGNVSNVGLMAKKAEEYGSHDKTFEIPEDGRVIVTTQNKKVILDHDVDKGDIWRMCQTKDIAIKDWVKLAVSRATATKSKTIFWLDKDRAHDNEIIKKVEKYIKDFDLSGLDIEVLPPRSAMTKTLEQVRNGKDAVSVTGNVLRDYLTDLFPILELGTSAKMLSIVPLLSGGCLYETGAGGSAPKHVQQLLKENHLRWDSLGEFLALAVSMEDMATKTSNTKLAIMAECMHKANEEFLLKNKSPSRKCGEIDNRGSHFYLIKYFSDALALQTQDKDLAEEFMEISKNLNENEDLIINELNQVQGVSADIGGYYHPNPELTDKVMRPSGTLNKVFN